jgi:hypothetical protein
LLLRLWTFEFLCTPFSFPPPLFLSFPLSALSSSFFFLKILLPFHTVHPTLPPFFFFFFFLNSSYHLIFTHLVWTSISVYFSILSPCLFVAWRGAKFCVYFGPSFLFWFSFHLLNVFCFFF